LTALLVNFSGGYQLTGLTVSAVRAQEAVPQQYTCGMHPLVISEEPGLCPICHMVLTPLHGHEESADGRRVIEVDQVTRQRMGVRTALAAKRQLHRNIRTVGLVAYEEPLQQAINSKISGWVEKLHISETGKSVKAGDPLLDIYSPELVAAQKELLLALRNRKAMEQSGVDGAAEDAVRLLEASRQRLQLWDIGDEQIAKLEETQEVTKTLTLYAPVAGVVSRKQVRVGEYIEAGRELLEISNLSSLWVFADIYEYEIPWVKVGQQAQVTFPFLEEPISGRVSTVYPYLDARSRTVKARIDLDNRAAALKPDMYAEVLIMAAPVAQVLCVPTEAVLFTGKRETIFVDLGDGRFEPRRVRVGLQDEEGFIEIRAGIAEGERVVTSAQFMFDSESKLREAVEKMRTPELEVEGDPEDLF
jgi:Cu(I)/Ag(I) efflux system membrane fusion protein/cobalt-zinc-cadmium efflux system membrane fusion protein